jgi:hypothetical protein
LYSERTIPVASLRHGQMDMENGSTTSAPSSPGLSSCATDQQAQQESEPMATIMPGEMMTAVPFVTVKLGSLEHREAAHAAAPATKAAARRASQARWSSVISAKWLPRLQQRQKPDNMQTSVSNRQVTGEHAIRKEGDGSVSTREDIISIIRAINEALTNAVGTGEVEVAMRVAALRAQHALNQDMVHQSLDSDTRTCFATIHNISSGVGYSSGLLVNSRAAILSACAEVLGL